jgi:hypothetical protein
LSVRSAIELPNTVTGSLLANVAARFAEQTALPGPTDCGDLLERLRQVSDGRSDTGRVHPVAAVLTLAAAAVVAGMRSFTAIAGWVADTPSTLLEPSYRVQRGNRVAWVPRVAGCRRWPAVGGGSVGGLFDGFGG